jgi:phosphatidylglycerophosphate synthase
MSNEKVILPEDYRDVVYRITYYLLGKVAHWVPRSITPNQITLTAFSSSLLSCLLLYVVQTPVGYLYWILFNFIWYILDALDGIHARLTQQTSEFGAFLDHFLDNIFFLFMLTVFTVRFDLAHTFYIFILFMRITAAATVFIVQVHTQRLYLTRFSGGLELLLFTSVMWFSYLYPNFNASDYFPNMMVDYLSLQQGCFMKLALLVYLIGIPINFLISIRFVQKHTQNREESVPCQVI